MAGDTQQNQSAASSLNLVDSLEIIAYKNIRHDRSIGAISSLSYLPNLFTDTEALVRLQDVKKMLETLTFDQKQTEGWSHVQSLLALIHKSNVSWSDCVEVEKAEKAFITYQKDLK